MATLRGEAVDRPPFNFYEIMGLENTSSQDPFNIFSHPSWKPLLDLAREKTDRLLLHPLPFKRRDGASKAWKPMPELEGQTERSLNAQGSDVATLTLRAGGRSLTQRTRRDRDVNTVWVTEHLLKDVDDFRAWLTLPEDCFDAEVDRECVLQAERRLGDSGLVLLDTPDPLCLVAPLFEMGTYTVIALTEPELFGQALEKMARSLYPKVAAAAEALPGRPWRIYGPEYAAPPYLPPRLYDEYVVRYVKPMVEVIQRYGGFARIHSHGKLNAILDKLCSTGCTGLDPIEPPPQGDVELAYVRERYGAQLALFGNLEIADIENLPTPLFREKVLRALREGTRGPGRGFVLQPSAAPYGRVLAPLTLRNYEAMTECAEGFAG